MKKLYILAIFFALTLFLATHKEVRASECTGDGLISSVAEGYLDDNGNSAYDDNLELYCRNGIVRLCLSGEACPWRDNIASADNLQCSMSGIGNTPTYDGNGVRFGGSYDPGYIWYAYVKGWKNISLWSGYNAYMCNSSGTQKKMVQFDQYGRVGGPVAINNPTPTPVPDPVYNTLYVSCFPSMSTAGINDLVQWNAIVSGGNGPYTYQWSGENISGSGSSVSVRYGSSGSKYASLTVHSGNQTETRSCGYVFVKENTNYYHNYDYNYNNYDYYSPYFSIQCYPSVYRASIGTYVTWRAVVSGDSSYGYSYYWTGTDGMYGNSAVTSYSYGKTGSKYATVTVRSGNRTISQSCGSVIVDDYYYNNYNNYSYGYTNSALGTCSPSTSFTTTGSVVTWNVYPTAGNWYYNYLWSGTDGFTGTQSSVATTYSTAGTKYANVTIYSNGQSSVLSCGTVQVSSPTVTKAKTVVKKKVVVVAPPAPTPAPVAPAPAPAPTAAATFNAFANVPWTFVMLVVIFVLFGTVMYLLANKKG